MRSRAQKDPEIKPFETPDLYERVAEFWFLRYVEKRSGDTGICQPEGELGLSLDDPTDYSPGRHVTVFLVT